MQVSGCGSTRHFSSDPGSAEVYMKCVIVFNQRMPCKHTVSFLPLKFCGFCRKQPLPFALSLSFCLSHSTVGISISFHCHLVSNQSADLKCSPISSPAVCECVTLAKPDNITLSDSIKTCYMSELPLMENAKKCWNMAYLKHGTLLSEIQEGRLKLSYQRHAVMLFTFITGSITHIHVIGKNAKWNAWLEH